MIIQAYCCISLNGSFSHLRMLHNNALRSFSSGGFEDLAIHRKLVYVPLILEQSKMLRKCLSGNPGCT